MAMREGGERERRCTDGDKRTKMHGRGKRVKIHVRGGFGQQEIEYHFT
jgi:hypothetical protein